MDMMGSVRKGVAYALICAFSVGGVFLIIYSASKHSLGITHDSAAYMHAARTFAQDFNLEYFGYQSPFIQWPPLYPMILAVGIWAGFDPVVFALYLNGVVYGAVILISGLWVFESTKKIPWTLLSVILLTLSHPLYHIARYMWSELLFIFFCLIGVLFLDSYIKDTGGKLRILAGAALFAALASLTRYLGVTLVMAFGAVILMQNKKLTTKILEALFFSGLSVIPLLVWLARNLMLTDTFSGGRSPSAITPSSVLSKYFDVMASWIAPANYGRIPHVIIGLLIIFTLVVVLRQRILHRDKNMGGPGILITFLLVYSAYLIATASMVAFDTINTRLLSPLYPFFVLALIFACSIYTEDMGGRGILSPLLSIVFFAILILPLSHSFTGIERDILTSRTQGSGVLDSDWWRGSPLVKYVENIPEDAMIISNNPDIIYVNTGRITRFPPKPGPVYWYGIKRMEESMESFGDTYLLWFESTYNNQILTLEELEQYFVLIPVKEFLSGRVYRIRVRRK